MKKLSFLTLSSLLSIYTSTATAESSWYIGAIYNTQEISIHQRDFDTAGVLAGYQIDKNLALEARYAKGVSGYSSKYLNSNRKYSEDIDTQASLVFKAFYPIAHSLNIYGLAGYTHTKLEFQGYGQFNDMDGNITGQYPFKANHTDSGFSYGMGLDFQLNSRLNLFVDYQVLPDFEPNSSVSRNWKSTTVGLKYTF